VAYRIRKALVEDIPELKLIRGSVTDNILVTSLTDTDYEQAITEAGCGWVAESEGRIVGFSMAKTDDSIWALFVLPDFEGHGIGRHLLEIATEWCVARGARRVWLCTGPGTRAERMYRSLGWQRGGREANGDVRYYLDTGE